ncbi:unnamed protein product [Closterium sp. Naga37s-1]|nr:unnamed protein product [Closterium sp. Naga37s-1]
MGALRALVSGGGCRHGLNHAAPLPSPMPRSSLLPALRMLSYSPIAHTTTTPDLPARAAFTPSWSRGLVSPVSTSPFFQGCQSRGLAGTFPRGSKAPHGRRKVASSSPADGHQKRLNPRAAAAGAAAEGLGEEGAEGVALKVPGICPGCGVSMQSEDPKLPGFFVLPAVLDPAKSAEVLGFEDEEGLDEEELEELEGLTEEEEEEAAGRKKVALWTEFDLKNRGSPGKLVEAMPPPVEVEVVDDVGTGFEEFDLYDDLDADLAAEASRKSGRKGGSDSRGYGEEEEEEEGEEEEEFDEEAWAKAWEEQMERNGADELKGGSRGATRGRGSIGARGATGSDVDGEEEEEGGQEKDGKLVVCARCHALRNYGQVKDESVENLLPDFDFERAVGQRLRAAYGRRAVVLVVVDAADFDGSFPRRAAELLARAEAEAAGKWKESQADGKAAGPPGGSNTFRLILAANKADLLPPQISPLRLEQWIRRRAKAGGLPRLTSLHLLSAKTGFGVGYLASQLGTLAGPRGDVWVVGAQNAGKSSLINALAAAVKTGGKGGKGGGKAGMTGKGAGGRRVGKKGGKGGGGGRGGVGLTEAWVPGTTIGVVPIEGVLGGRTRVMDTPGLLHPHQLSVRLSREELKVVVPRKALKPRTFRIKVRRWGGVSGFGFRVRVMDTPGLLHPQQLSVRLSREELKVVVPRKALKPRTFRIKLWVRLSREELKVVVPRSCSLLWVRQQQQAAPSVVQPGQCILLGGLARVDVEEAAAESIYLTFQLPPSPPPFHLSFAARAVRAAGRTRSGQCILLGGLARVDVEEAAAESIYLTVWLSPMIACHMGKIANAPAVLEKHVGVKLQPPAEASRMADLGMWLPRSVTVEGTRWDQSSADVAVAGLGWVAVGIKGSAKLKVWTFEGVGVTVREAMVFDYAPVFERPGFSTGGLPVTREEGGKGGSGGGGAVGSGSDGKKTKKKTRGGSNRSRPDEVDAVVL